MPENEEWRDIAGYEGLYKVSNLGRVMRVKGSPKARSDRLLKFEALKKGYATVCLCKNGKVTRYLVHRIVAMAFLTGGAKREVDHIDGDCTNNIAKNLRWVTSYENKNNPITVQRRKQRFRPVVCVEEGKIFDSITSAARYFRASQGNICNAARGTAKTAYGFHWRYATPEEIEKLPG